MLIESVCTCSADIILTSGFSIRDGIAFCNTCGKADSTSVSNQLTFESRHPEAASSKFDGILLGAWLFVTLQGLAGGLAMGYIFETSKCDYYACHQAFNTGLFFAGFVGTIVVFGPFIFIIKTLVEIGKSLRDLRV